MGPAPDAHDRDLIRSHQERVQHLVVPMAARYRFGELDQTPEGRALLDAPRSLRASLAIAALAGPRSGNTAALLTAVPGSEQWPADVVDALLRRTIEWDAPSAALVLRLVADTDFDDQRFQLVLKAADQIAETHPAQPEVMDGLERLHARAQATSAHRYRVPEMRARVIASIARHSPPELLDLSPIADTDTWGPAARSIITEADDQGTDVRSLLTRLTAAPTSSTPSARWLSTIEPVLRADRARATTRGLVALLVELDLEVERPFVAPGNDSLARAAVWALGEGEVTDGDVLLMRQVAARCSRTNGQPHETRALCGKATGAAITVLGRLHEGGDDLAEPAERALRALWEEVDRGDVLRRIGAVLGCSPDEIAARVREAKRAKAARDAQRANPEPAKRSARLAEVIDEDVAQRMRDLGFAERSRRTFRRHHLRHTDVASISTAAGTVWLTFGLGFHAPSERPAWKVDDLDVAADLALRFTGAPEAGSSLWLEHRATMFQDRSDRRASRGQVDPLETLARLMERFADLALPALDRWADAARLADDLEHLDVPFPHGTLLIGLDAPFAEERKRTVRRLRALD